MISLSICIPTFNRSSYLKRTLDSIVQQKYFQDTNDVEIVISDNCSTDSTESISRTYVDLYPGKIVYSRNAENTKDKNFELSLRKGKGKYLKLNTDYQEHLDHSLEIIVNEIRRNIQSKPNLLFTNGALGVKDRVTNSGKDRFLSLTSHYSTWIGMFGIWRSDFESIDDFGRSTSLQLTQLDNLYRVLTLRPSFILIDIRLFQSAPLQPKRQYDLLTVFFDNYFKILSQHVGLSGIKTKTLRQERRKVLLMFICGWAARSSLSLDASFVVERHWSRVFRYCSPDLILFAHYTLKYAKNWLFFWYGRKYGVKVNDLINFGVFKQ